MGRTQHFGNACTIQIPIRKESYIFFKYLPICTCNRWYSWWFRRWQWFHHWIFRKLHSTESFDEHVYNRFCVQPPNLHIYITMKWKTISLGSRPKCGLFEARFGKLLISITYNLLFKLISIAKLQHILLGTSQPTNTSSNVVAKNQNFIETPPQLECVNAHHVETIMSSQIGFHWESEAIWANRSFNLNLFFSSHSPILFVFTSFRIALIQLSGFSLFMQVNSYFFLLFLYCIFFTMERDSNNPNPKMTRCFSNAHAIIRCVRA